MGKSTDAYDNADRLTSVNNSGTPGSPQVTLTYAYDKNGNRTSLTDTTGTADTYEYNARNLLDFAAQSGSGSNASSVAPELAFFNYDAAGNLTSLTRYANTTATTKVATTTDAYDNAERLTNITHATAAGATIASYGYTLDAANRLTSEAHAWNGGSSTDTITYGYTNNNQLTAVTHSNSALANESFSYDQNGNRNASGQTTITGNEVQSDGTYNYTYDADGNLVKKTTIATGTATTYTRDDRNRLTEVDSVSGSTTTVVARFTYDALNRQIAEVDNPNGSAATRWTVYDGMTPLLDYNGSGTLQARYLSVPGAIDELLARQTTSGVAWYLDDREGSVKDLVSNSGAVLDHVDYTAYGQVAAESVPTQGDRFKYAGMELDAAINFYYDRARYYDPAAGRFIGQDPTGFAAGDDNLYRYTSNEPTNAIDVSGLAQDDPNNNNEGAYLNPDITAWFPGYTNLRQQYPNFPTGGWDQILADPDVLAQIKQDVANSQNTLNESGGYILWNPKTCDFMVLKDGARGDQNSTHFSKPKNPLPPGYIIIAFYHTHVRSGVPSDGRGPDGERTGDMADSRRLNGMSGLVCGKNGSLYKYRNPVTGKPKKNENGPIQPR